MLTLNAVSSGYSMIRVLKDVTLEVPRGRAAALVGPNGAGKTTLLETIAGFVALQSGSIRFGDAELGTARPEQRARAGIVLVPDKRHLFADLTAAENLRLGRCSAPAPERWNKAAVARAMERVLTLFPKLRAIHDRPVRVMSGGEQQMVAVGRALMAEPQLLMLDEPSQGLAPLLVQALYEAIRAVARETTVLIVEQDLGLARSVAADLYWILDGVVRRLAPEEAADETFMLREIFGRPPADESP